jgi:putative phosphoribosyl transferase
MSAHRATATPGEVEVSIPVDSITLEGTVASPREGHGLVIFAHGTGSSRFSPRNNFVARVLREAGLGSLLFDLLTVGEDAHYDKRFDIGLLAQRLMAATKWAIGQFAGRTVKIGYFGASTGAAAALWAAAELGSISAIVSRGGRPDLAEPFLPRVKAPTLLIVGEYDPVVLDLNREAYKKIQAEKELAIVPGATHLFEEPGALERVAQLAKDWFRKYLG